MIDPRTVENIIETAQVEEVVGEFVHLKKRGANYIGLCPFHNEKTPSFTVSPSKGIYKCFGCGQAGNSVKFLMEHEHHSFPEALKYLAAKYNIEIEESADDKEAIMAEDKRESMFVVTGFAQQYYSKNLFEHEDGMVIGLSYFKERGYREDIIKKFQLGYALNDYTSFTDKALKKGYKLELLKELGLTGEKNGRRYDFFKDRVIFPIHNLSGKVIAFAGRTLSKEKSIPKYINSPETPIYNKSKVLYGAYFAKNEIRKQDECFLVEGYTDVISLHQNDIENVVASSGTSLTQDQVRLIKRYTHNITILYDGDLAGIKAATRGLDIVLEEGMNVKIVILPENEDPDSYIKLVGTSEFLKYTRERAQDFIFFKADTLAEESKHDPVKKADVIKDMVSTIAKIPDPIKRSLYVRECSEKMDVSEQLLINELNKFTRQKLQKNSRLSTVEAEDLANVTTEKREKQQLPTDSDLYYQERDVMRLLMEYGDKELEEEIKVADFILHDMEEVELHHPVFQKIIDIFNEKMAEDEIPSEKYFIHHEDPEISGLAIDLITDKYELSKNWEKMHEIVIPEKGGNYKQDVLSAIFRLKLTLVNKYIKRNQEELKAAANDEELQQLLQTRMQLNNMKSELAEKLNTVIVK